LFSARRFRDLFLPIMRSMPSLRPFIRAMLLIEFISTRWATRSRGKANLRWIVALIVALIVAVLWIRGWFRMKERKGERKREREKERKKKIRSEKKKEWGV